MRKTKSPGSPPSRAPAEEAGPVHRSGAVARMLRMPVATLRVWERRYGLTQPQLTPSGQRLYSAQDVRRLVLVKQLTDLGHAIGSLAALNMAQLQRVAATHAQALTATEDRERREPDLTPPVPAWRVVLVGAALRSRLQRPALLRRLGRPVVLLGPFDNIAQAAAALQGAEIDTLLMHEPQLHAGWLADLNAAAPALAGVPKAVLFRFAADPVCEALATAGTALLREPQPDAAVAQWLDSLASQAAAAPQSPAGLPTSSAHTATHTAPPRRWDDAALAAFASLSPTMACECPRHVAELLMQLSHFEAYSAACENRNLADAQLHAYLRQVATAARTRFEAALEHVALHEGLLLPTTATAVGPAAVPPARRAKAIHAQRPRPQT